MVPFLEIIFDRQMKEDILPKIDSLATDRKDRSDVVRDILYKSFDYTPRQLSEKQKETNKLAEKEMTKGSHLTVVTDEAFRNIFFKTLIAIPHESKRDTLPSDYRRLLQLALYDYFGIKAPAPRVKNFKAENWKQYICRDYVHKPIKLIISARNSYNPKKEPSDNLGPVRL
jgi:hypothetical protein